LAELDIAAAYVGPDIVDKVGRRPENHGHRVMLVIAPPQLTYQQQGQQGERDCHRPGYW
jgi:hypothetical protein